MRESQAQGVAEGPSAAAVRAMFSRVAHRYDFLNRLLSLRQDVGWRRRLVRSLQAAPEGRVLDLATGTGDVALAVRQRSVVGTDFCWEMLARARAKAQRRGRLGLWVAADALALPFRARSFAAVTVAFGVRNFSHVVSALGEIRRVLCPEGLLSVLEFHPLPPGWRARVFSWWQRWVMEPVGGWVSGDREAYRYLPSSSRNFLSPEDFRRLVEGEGFLTVGQQLLSGGVAVLSVFRKEGL